MTYKIAFWVATVVAALLFRLFIWASRRALKTQEYNNRLFVEVLTSHKVRDEALARIKELENGKN